MSTVSSSSPQTVEYSGVGGITLVADEWNRDSAAPTRPAILMLHGGGQNRFSWKNTGQILADEGYHVIALDSRGHGDSARAPDANYAIETLTADVMLAVVLERIHASAPDWRGVAGALAAASAAAVALLATDRHQDRSVETPAFRPGRKRRSLPPACRAASTWERPPIYSIW